MKTTLSRMLAVVVLVCGAASFAHAKDRVVTVGGERISIAVPMGFSFETKSDEEGNRVVALSNPVWPIEILVIMGVSADPVMQTREGQENMLITHMADAFSQTGQKDYGFKPLEAVSGKGVYCVLTDEKIPRGAQLPPNEFRHMVGAMKTWGKTGMVFLLHCNDITTPEYQEAFALVTQSFRKL